MRIKLDENLPLRLVTSLEDLGHDVRTTPEEGLIGHADCRDLGNGAKGIKVPDYPRFGLF
jgi:hypothetical protein